MDKDELEQVWKKVEDWKRCDDCPLKRKNESPLLFKPKCQVNVIVITEGPNRIATKDVIASLATHPTYTFLYALFGGKFEPRGKKATAYWTHVRKCFISDKNGKPLSENDINGKKALRKCRSEYLYNEIKTGPKFVVAVGRVAQKSLAKLDRRFKEKFGDVFKKQIREQKLFETTIFGQFVKIGVVPHPSGRNLFWGSPPMGTAKVLKLIRNEIINIIGKQSA